MKHVVGISEIVLWAADKEQSLRCSCQLAGRSFRAQRLYLCLKSANAGGYFIH